MIVIDWFRAWKNRNKQSNLERHAFREFKALGYKSIDQEDDGPDKWIQENIIELLRVFSKQGHSGFSAPYCISMFQKLAKFEPLGPLIGADDEWNDVSDYFEVKTEQNNRCSHVFRENGRAYDIDAVVYEEPSGARFTKGGSCHYIEFPYAPTTKVVFVDFEGNEIVAKGAE